MKLTNQKLLEVQQALLSLNKLKLPVLTSMDIAFLGNTIDADVNVFAKVRDKLFRDYQITFEPVGNGNAFRFLCKDKEREAETLEEFMPKFNELVAAETADLKFKKIALPKDIEIEPEILKPLMDFIEVA